MTVIPYAAIRKLRLNQALTPREVRLLKLMRGVQYSRVRGK